jgi:phage gp29-like protein
MADDYKPVIDQFGNPISRSEIAVLKTQIAAPNSFGSRPPFTGDLAFATDPRRLGMLIRGANNGNTREWFILAEEIEENFPHYAAVLSKRKRQVTLLPMTVEAAKDVKDGEKHADFVRKWLDTQVLQHAMFDISDAIGKGYSVNEIMWDTSPTHVWPAEIIWRHQRDFEVSWEDGETIWLRCDAGFAPLARHKFLLHAHKTKSGGAARSGITRLIAFMWMFSTFTLKDWALFVQGYGLPVRLGRYGAEASESDKRTLWRAVRGIAGDLAAIIPKSMEMEFIEAKGANDGAKLFPERANWLNYEVSKLVLGGTAGTDAIAGGHAVGQEHRSAEQDVEKFDAMLLAGNINRQIVQPSVAFTFGPQTGYPRIKIGTKEQVPLSDVIAAVADLGPLGFKTKASEVRDRLQLTAPEGDDEVIGTPPQPPAGAAAVDADGNPLVKADLTPKANPHPEINPNSDTRALMTQQKRMFGRLIATHTADPTPIMDALSARLEREAAGAMASMTAQVRECFEQASDMHDLAARLGKLQLDDTAFMTAMTQGMALANLVGQAELLDEIAPHAKARQA